MTLANPIDHYFEKHSEPDQSCLLALRHFILGMSPEVSEVWRYSMPFYCFREKRFCYLWIDKKRNQPYVGLVDGYKITHPALLQEKRSRMKILLIDPNKDLPVTTLRKVLKEAMRATL